MWSSQKCNKWEILSSETWKGSNRFNFGIERSWFGRDKKKRNINIVKIWKNDGWCER
jgi:hypothetical protein